MWKADQEDYVKIIVENATGSIITMTGNCLKLRCQARINEMALYFKQYFISNINGLSPEPN